MKCYNISGISFHLCNISTSILYHYIIESFIGYYYILQILPHPWNIIKSLNCYNVTGMLLHLYNITTSFEYYNITRYLLHSGILLKLWNIKQLFKYNITTSLKYYYIIRILLIFWISLDHWNINKSLKFYTLEYH